MNNWNGIGRLTKDSEMTFLAGSGTAVCKFTLAVDRDFKNKNGVKEADFINCSMFGKSAEVLSPYLVKGKLVGVTGEIRTGSYEAKDGSKRYTTEIVVGKTKFLDKKEGQAPRETQDYTECEDSSDIPF